MRRHPVGVFDGCPDQRRTPAGEPGAVPKQRSVPEGIRQRVKRHAPLTQAQSFLDFRRARNQVGQHKSWQENFFITEQLAVSPHFKLTLGLRYELNTVPHEKNRRIENTFSSPEVQRLIAAEKALPGSGGVSGFELYLAGRDGIFNGDRNNLAPHLAFAWDPRKDGKTSVRAGYGIYYDQIPGAVISQSRNVFPRFLTFNRRA